MAEFGAARGESLCVVQRLCTDFSDVIHAHQRNRFARLVGRQGSPLLTPAAGDGRDAAGVAASVRNARSAAAIHWSSGKYRRFGHVAEN